LVILPLDWWVFVLLFTLSMRKDITFQKFFPNFS